MAPDDRSIFVTLPRALKAKRASTQTLMLQHVEHHTTPNSSPFIHADRLARRHMILANTRYGEWPGFIGPGVLINQVNEMRLIEPADRYQIPNFQQFWKTLPSIEQPFSFDWPA